MLVANRSWHICVLFGDTLAATLPSMPAKQKRPRSKRGKIVNWTEPNWEPILHLARIYVDEFMWMGEIELTGGARLQAYKNYWTRRYIHLDEDGNAFAYRGDDLYRKVPEEELRELFDAVIRRPDPALPRCDA
jgi:hypothetical protein